MTISRKFIPSGPINNGPALFKKITWRHTGEKNTIWINAGLVNWRIEVSSMSSNLLHFVSKPILNLV